MSKIKRKYIEFDNTINGVNAQVIPSNFTPVNFTPVQVGSEGTDKISADLNGLDIALTGKEQVFNGIKDSSQYTISYSASTRQFTITTTASAVYYVDGVQYIPGAGTVTTAAHANTTGLWFCYYNSSGVITVTSTPWDLLNNAPIILAYYNAVTVKALVYDERHAGGANGMSPAVHKNLHTTRGTQLVSGLVASGYTLNTNGLANTSYAISAGSIADEDLVIACAAQLQGGANTYRILYQSGTTAAPVWNWIDDAEGGIYSNGTDIYWNQLTGGNWTLTPDTTTGTFLNYWVMATTTLAAPQIMIFMGQATYGTLALAQAASFSTEMANYSSVAAEGVILYQMTYQRGAFGAPGNIRLRSVNKITSALTSVGAGSGTVVSVGLLDNTGLFNIIGSPVTSSGNLTLDSLQSQAANTVFAAPNGSSGAPSFRSLVSADVPTDTFSAKATSFTAANGFIYLVSPTAAINIQLPTPAVGLRFTVKDANNTFFTNNVTLVRAGSEKIDNIAASFVLSSTEGSWNIVSDGTNWWIL